MYAGLNNIGLNQNNLFSPQNLFTGGEQGVFYDPNDLNTLFQDSAGTTPVTAVGQPVGRINDKSGRGNHATQATAASRPTLSARYNLADNTENGTAMWPITSNVTLAAGSDGSCQITRSAAVGDDRAQQNITIPAIAVTYKVSLRFTKGGSTSATLEIYGSGGGDTAHKVTTFNLSTGAISAGAGTVTDGGTYWLVSDTVTTVAANTTLVTQVRQDAGTTITTNRIDIRTSADAALNIPSYQRVTTASDYDTTGFPLYLSFDGVDDSMATGSVDFSATDKMTVWVGVHKAAEGTGIIYELTADTSATNGALDGYTDTGGVLAYGLRATVAGEASTAPSVAAPASRVSTASYYLSGASAAERLQVRLDGVAQTLTGVAGPTTPPANFANAPLYFGRRGGSSFPFNGRLYSLVVRGAASASGLVSQTERWVGARMGINL